MWNLWNLPKITQLVHGKERIQKQQTQVFLKQGKKRKKESQMESKGYMKLMI